MIQTHLILMIIVLVMLLVFSAFFAGSDVSRN